MTKPLSRQKLRSRLKDYAERTGIRFETRVRRLVPGLPDLRGFTPHLRAVQLNAGTSAGYSDWLLHDLLHIVFYDFATLNLGASSWLEHGRFVENHLASEAFAVLALDYSVLAYAENRTLTIDLNAAEWERFQKLNPRLPPLRTYELCEMLLTHYLTGEHGHFQAQRPSRRYAAWLEHEIRYARKQRAYVEMWFSDLNCAPYRKTAAVVRGSAVADAVWWLLETLLGPDDSPWAAHIAEVASSVPRTVNVFAGFKKYRLKNPEFDYRFTDIAAAGAERACRELSAAREPAASSLYLAWQIL
ncbi:MAG TPA: hypothetical protein VFV50_09270, partial [Bdellovibrionales bacterium]|nr:hypothetical protein [Bdellovibrionales bacterium]